MRYQAYEDIRGLMRPGDVIAFGGSLHFSGIGYNSENFERFFCSELAAAGLKAAGVIPPQVNASEATPIDVCRL